MDYLHCGAACSRTQGFLRTAGLKRSRIILAPGTSLVSRLIILPDCTVLPCECRQHSSIGGFRIGSDPNGNCLPRVNGDTSALRSEMVESGVGVGVMATTRYRSVPNAPNVPCGLGSGARAPTSSAGALLGRAGERG